MRPVSIIQFERCYLGAIAIGLLNGAITAPASLPRQAVSVVISLLLWYFVARRASVVAKWILTVLFALGVLGLLAAYTFVRSYYPQVAVPMGLSAVLAIVAIVLQAVAVYLLFRPDSDRWFGGRADAGGRFR